MKRHGAVAKMVRISSLVILQLFCLHSALALAQRPQMLRPLLETPPSTSEREFRFESNAQVATRCKVTDPAYPEGELRKGVVGDVRVSAKVDRRGRLFDLTARASNSAANGLAKAALHEATMWRVRPKIDMECKPIEYRIEAVVTFAIEDGAPVVVTRFEKLPSSAAVVPNVPRMRNERTVNDGIRFPYTAWSSDLEGNIFVAIDVDARTGRTMDVRVVSREAPNHVGTYFDEMVIAAFKKAEFEPQLDAGSDSVRVCRNVDFCIPR